MGGNLQGVAALELLMTAKPPEGPLFSEEKG
jgi:hypothetical protein